MLYRVYDGGFYAFVWSSYDVVDKYEWFYLQWFTYPNGHNMPRLEP